MFYRLKKLSAILLAAGLLAGCAAPGVPTRETEEPEYVTVWNYYNGPQKERFDLLVQRFNETEGLEKKIVVEAVSMGNLGGLVQAISESAEEQIGSAKLPQLCAAYADTALELDQKGLLADIRPYLTQEELDTYVDAYLEEGSFSEDGSLKIFPTAKSTEVMTLNQTAWAPFSEATGTDISEPLHLGGRGPDCGAVLPVDRCPDAGAGGRQGLFWPGRPGQLYAGRKQPAGARRSPGQGWRAGPGL